MTKMSLYRAKYLEQGDRLKKLRGSIPQGTLASEIGVSLRTYQRYESGERLPPGRVLEKIARVLHVSIEYIVSGNEESLWRLLEQKRAGAESLNSELITLDMELERKLREKGIPAPKDLPGFIHTASYLRSLGIDMLALIQNQSAGLHRKGEDDIANQQIRRLDIDILKEIIVTVEDIFSTHKLHLPSKKKAELIGLLYEEILEDETKKLLINDRILKLVKLAS